MIDRPLDSTRPALVKLVQDLEDLEDDLLAGFGSRREVLDWTRELSIRTLGELPQDWFYQLARQFRGLPSSGGERVLLSAMLVEKERERSLGNVDAKELRERLSVLTIRPAAHRAFRSLRKDASEYVEGGDESAQHAPGKQRFVAMRPAIDELEEFQTRALGALLDGFDDREDVLDWAHDLELATHGEIPEQIVPRCYREPSTVDVLTGRDTASRRARELFAAHHVVPHFNAGIRDLAGRSKEMADAETEQSEVQLA